MGWFGTLKVVWGDPTGVWDPPVTPRPEASQAGPAGGWMSPAAVAGGGEGVLKGC